MASINFKIIKNFFSKEELNILQPYCYHRLNSDKDYVLDAQSFSPSWYKDSLMNSFLNLKLNLMKKETGLELLPTYTYWRYYVFGATLSQHTDREACEISISACVKKYDDWPLIIEGKKIELEEGEALMYAGVDQLHGRPGVYKGDGMAQVFFHYVDKNGPYEKYAYDALREFVLQKEEFKIGNIKKYDG